MDYKVFNKKCIQDLDGKLLKVTQQTRRRAREGDTSSETQQNASKPRCFPCWELKGDLGWKISSDTKGTAKVQVSKCTVCSEYWKL